MRAIEITMHLTVLSKHVLVYLFLELLFFDEVVFAAVYLALSGSTGCITNAQLEYFGVFLEQVSYDSAFACA